MPKSLRLFVLSNDKYRYRYHHHYYYHYGVAPNNFVCLSTYLVIKFKKLTLKQVASYLSFIMKVLKFGGSSVATPQRIKSI
ncbi:MAG: hypothetical protein ACKO96_35520, partial [Flammeovirgaceae bacterium]